MSKNTRIKKLDKNMNNNHMNNLSNKQIDNKQYNVIINQNSTINQDHSINIMLDGSFPYFQNYNTYQMNENKPNKNKMYPLYLEQQSIQGKNNTKNISNDDNDIKINKDDNINNKEKTPKRKKKKNKNIKNLEEIENQNQCSTNKIDYRYTKKRPIKDLIDEYKKVDIEENKDDQLFWFATYDKLMKTKYLQKIFNYYNNKPYESNKTLNYNLKEKTLVIKDFEIYFYENSNKPFIRYAKGGTIYTKLYLLTLKQICQIFSYINRIEYKINYDRLNYLQRKGNFDIVNDNSNGVILPYCLIYCLGKYMNTNIYSFSNNIDYNIYSDESSFYKSQRISSYTEVNNNRKIININNKNYAFSNEKEKNNINKTNINQFKFKLPSSKKLAKLIKIINLNFPEFSIDDVINYLIPENKYINSIAKIIDIKNIIFFKKSIQNKIILSSMVRDTVKGISIQTPKSLLSSFCPCESIIENNSFKNSDLFQRTSKKYVVPIKDDYKFQILNTNEKDNNKSNPFIIHVVDNASKINFINDNNNSNNNTIEQNSFLRKEINKQYENLNLNYINNNSISLASEKKNTNIILNIDNDNIIDNNDISKEKITSKQPKKKRESKFEKDINNIISNKNGKNMKIQRLSTDINKRIKTSKYKSLTGTKKININIHDSSKIPLSKVNLTNNLNNITQSLDKSIESHQNYNNQYRLSKTSDMNIKSRHKTKNKNNNSKIKRKALNPFYGE